MQEDSFRCGDRRVHFGTSRSDAPPLLMLHGVTRRWQTFLPLCASLMARWQLNAMDFRGHGESDRVRGQYFVSDYAADALGYLDARPGQPIVIYGHSLGAMVAADVAAKASDRVAALILEDPPLHTMGERISRTPYLSFFRLLHGLAGSSHSVAEITQLLADAMIRDPVSETETRLGDQRDETSLRFTASCLRKLDPATLGPIVDGQWLHGFDVRSVFRSIRCPCLILQADPAAGGMLTDEDAGSLRSWLPDPVHVKFTSCGHVIHWSQTTQLLNCVHGFLESLT